MAHLSWTEPALRDLESIAEVIALDKPAAAKAFVQKVFRGTERLIHFPKSGRIPPEIPDLPYRELIVPPCRVFYRIDRGEVYVVHVLRSERELREESLEKGRE